MKKKKILFYTHEFNIKEGGPCTKRIDSFASYLSDKNYDVVILTGKHNKKNEYKLLDKKYKIIYSPIFALGKKKNIYRFIEQFSFSFFSFFIGLFKTGEFDFIVTTSPPPLISFTGYFLSKIKKSKLIYDVRDIWPQVAVEMGSFKINSVYYKVFSFISNFMYKHSDFITTVTPGKIEKLKNLVVNKSKIIYIPNGFDDEFTKFKVNNEIIKKYDLDKKATIVYTGNIGLAQNLDALVNLADKYKNRENIQFLIFGDGAYRENLILNINKLHLDNIMVEGKIKYCDVYTILKYSKISFVSLKNSNMKDSVPTKIFDALGVGCPILLLADGDSCKIIDDSDFGEHVSNENDLYDKLEYMLNNYEKYERDKSRVIKYIKNNYSRKKIAEKFEKEVLLYEREI